MPENTDHLILCSQILERGEQVSTVIGEKQTVLLRYYYS